MPYVLQVSPVWFVYDYALWISRNLKADTLKYAFSGNGHSQIILHFKCTVKEDSLSGYRRLFVQEFCNFNLIVIAI